MKLSDFLNNKEIYSTSNLINNDSIKGIEKELNVSFGGEMEQYILNYGYLAYKHIEFYGINSKQMSDSDMVKQTKYLHEYFPKTMGFIALENKGDGVYIIVSAKDEVFIFDSEDDSIQKTDLRLFDYIIKCFQEADE